MFIGHQKNLDYLEKAFKDNSLANVYCFVGPEEVGKKTMAMIMAGEILGVIPEKLATHPDFLFIERGKDEKNEKTKKDISVDQVIKVGGFIKNKAWLQDNKVVIVDGAHFLNSSSANAFLKILEEPGEKCFIFLVTDDEKKLPATILSRSQIIYFSLVGDNEMKEKLLQNQEGVDIIEELLYWSWGRPGKLKKLMQDEFFLNELRGEKKRWQRMMEQSFYERLKEVDSLFGLPQGDHIESREKLISILDIWTMLWREYLKSGCGKFSQDIVLEVLENLRVAREMLQKNIHPRMLVEKILLTF